MRSGQFSIRWIREFGPAVTKGKSLTKADLDSCERISIGNAYGAHDGLRLRIIAESLSNDKRHKIPNIPDRCEPRHPSLCLYKSRNTYMQTANRAAKRHLRMPLFSPFLAF